MTTTAPLLGRTTIVVDDAQEQVAMPDVRPLPGTGINDVRSAFEPGEVDHVIMGAGIDLDKRLDSGREDSWPAR